MNREELHDRTTIMVIGGMQGAACVSRIQNALRSLQGVETAGVNLLTRLATVRHSASIRPQQLVEALAVAGYQATMASPGANVHRHISFGDTIDVIASRRARFIVGTIFTVLTVLVNELLASNNTYKLMLLFLLASPVQIMVGWEFYRGCLRGLRKGIINTDTLVVMGTTAAYLQGFLCFIGVVSVDPDLMKWQPQFHIAALVLTVISLGRWLESRARESTSRIWSSLIEMTPSEACTLRDGREQIIPAGVVAVGDIVLIRPNEKIPVDGEIVEGSTEVNEGLLTGESRPVPKVKGDRVFVASTNGPGFIRVRALGVGMASTLSQIARMVTEAQEHKAPAQRMADRVSRIFVTAAVGIAAIAFLFWYVGPMAAQALVSKGWISMETAASYRDGWLAFLFAEPSLAAALSPALAVLVVSTPCAVGLATPGAVLAATGIGARRGIFVKDGAALEAAARITDVVFDKTGTLTDGTFRVQEILTAPGVDREEMLTLMASLEACSEHALAKGVVREAKRKTLILRRTENFEPLSERGLKGVIGGVTYLSGSRGLLAERGFPVEGDLKARADAAEAAGSTLIFLAAEGSGVLGAIAMADLSKESAPPAIAALHADGMNVHLLSGDNPAAALAVGKECGLKPEEVHPLMRPENKVEFTLELQAQGRKVAAVGDGINDAPVLAAADVGFAIGTGLDIAIESGQIVLVSGDVRGVNRAIRLARRTARTVRYNLYWAFLFNATLIPLAFFNRLAPSHLAAVMAISVVLVTVNSLRLLYSGPAELGAELPVTGRQQG